MMPDAIQVRSTRRPGHFWADNELVDVYGPRIGGYGIGVYMVLCRFARNDSGECHVSQSKIAALLGSSKQKFRKAVAELESVEWADEQNALAHAMAAES